MGACATNTGTPLDRKSAQGAIVGTLVGAASGELIHDADHYILKAQHGEQWAADDKAVDATLAPVRAAHPGLELWLEPGRYLVAECGVLLTRATQLKQKSDLTYVGVDTGMNSLIRPALYGARHEIVNLTRLDEDADMIADIVGPICESADRLGAQRLLPETREGDVILIGNGGAYGRVMASRYNMREPAGEVVI